MLPKTLLSILLIAITLFAHADENSLDTLVLKSIVASRALPQERVYLHFDNSGYYLGETMWFKAYCVILFVNDSLPLAERQFFVMHEIIQPGDRETENHSQWRAVA